MKYRGRVEGGVVMLDSGTHLDDGTIVEVEPVPQLRQPSPGTAAAILRHAGIWEGEKEEVDRLLREIQAIKKAELESQLKAEQADEQLE